jgi:long-subunit fatty acid transport protein
MPVLVLLFAWSEARAGGFEFPTNGTAALGRGGAFTARADDLVCMEYNPAGLINIPGTTFYVANNMSLFNMEFTRLLPDGAQAAPVSNEAGLFPFAPFVAMSTDAGTRDWRFSVAAFGPSAYGRTAYATDRAIGRIIPISPSPPEYPAFSKVRQLVDSSLQPSLLHR